MTDVNDLVQECITRARVRAARARQRRGEFAAARRRGLVARHAAKRRRLEAAEGLGATSGPREAAVRRHRVFCGAAYLPHNCRTLQERRGFTAGGAA